MTSDEFTLFFIYAGKRFQQLRLHRTHILATVSCAIGSFLSFLVTESSHAVPIAAASIAAVNLVITITHYSACWFEWKKLREGP